MGWDRGRRHDIRDCLQYDTAEIIDETAAMQQYIEKVGGFQGKGGCSWCGIPRAVCQRWDVQADGGWEEVPGQQCQYQGMLVPAVIIMLMDGCHEG